MKAAVFLLQAFLYLAQGVALLCMQLLVLQLGQSPFGQQLHQTCIQRGRGRFGHPLGELVTLLQGLFVNGGLPLPVLLQLAQRLVGGLGLRFGGFPALLGLGGVGLWVEQGIELVLQPLDLGLRAGHIDEFVAQLL